MKKLRDSKTATTLSEVWWSCPTIPNSTMFLPFSHLVSGFNVHVYAPWLSSALQIDCVVLRLIDTPEFELVTFSTVIVAFVTTCWRVVSIEQADPIPKFVEFPADEELARP